MPAASGCAWRRAIKSPPSAVGRKQNATPDACLHAAGVISHLAVLGDSIPLSANIVASMRLARWPLPQVAVTPNTARSRASIGASMNSTACQPAAGAFDIRRAVVDEEGCLRVEAEAPRVVLVDRGVRLDQADFPRHRDAARRLQEREALAAPRETCRRRNWSAASRRGRRRSGGAGWRRCRHRHAAPSRASCGGRRGYSRLSSG